VRNFHEERGEHVFFETLPLTFTIKIPTICGEVDPHHLRLELKQFKQIYKLLEASKDIKIDPTKTS
jgi:hypothetical protein